MSNDPHEPSRAAHPQPDARRPYEPPRLRGVELLPEETLGFGCKTQSEVHCQVGFDFGS